MPVHIQIGILGLIAISTVGFIAYLIIAVKHRREIEYIQLRRQMTIEIMEMLKVKNE